MPYADPSSPTSSTSTSSALSSPLAGRSRRSSGASTTIAPPPLGAYPVQPPTTTGAAALPSMPSTSSVSTLALSPSSPNRSRSGSSSSGGTIGGGGGGDTFTLRPVLFGVVARPTLPCSSSSSSRTPSPRPIPQQQQQRNLADLLLPPTPRTSYSDQLPETAGTTSFHGSRRPPSPGSGSGSGSLPHAAAAAPLSPMNDVKVAHWAHTAAKHISRSGNNLIGEQLGVPLTSSPPSMNQPFQSPSGSDSSSSTTTTTTTSSSRAESPRLTPVHNDSSSFTPETSAQSTPTGSLLLAPEATHPSKTTTTMAAAPSSSSVSVSVSVSAGHTPRNGRSPDSSGTSTPHRMRSPGHPRTTSPGFRRHPSSYAPGSASAGFFVLPNTPGSEHAEVGEGVGVGMGERGGLPGLPRRSSSAAKLHHQHHQARVDGLPSTSLTSSLTLTSPAAWSSPSSSSGPTSPMVQTSPLNDGVGSLGIKLGAPAVDASRDNRESISSLSTTESSGPETPVESDEVVASLKQPNVKHHPRPPLSSSSSHAQVLHHRPHQLVPHNHHLKRSQSSSSGGEESDTESNRETTSKDVTDTAVKTPTPATTTETTKVSVIPFPTSASDSPPRVHNIPLGTPPTPPTLSKIFSQTSKPAVVNPRHPPRPGPSVGLRRQPSSSLQLDIHSISSTSQHWQNEEHGHTASYHRPSSIRKKSGELVKPSLKQRSLSTPHLPIRHDYGATKSEPATPSVEGSEFGSERSKNVRFAGQDDDKSQLEYVRHFQRGSRVIALSKEGDNDAEATEETETDGDTDNSYVSFRTSRNAAAAAADEAERVVFSEYSTSVPRVRLDFAPFRSEEDKAKLATENVVLERLDLPNDAASLVLRGTVLVRNVAFQKWVAVRFTLDHWQTVSEVSASHVTHIPPTTTRDKEGWDRFSFSIKLDDVKRRIEEKELLLCVRYSVEGKEWWDSNNGHNYRFGFKKVKPPRPSRMSGISRRSVTSPDSPELPASRLTAPPPPLPGVRASSFGRSSGWNFPTHGSPRMSPTASGFSSPTRPALHRHDSPRNRSPPRLPTFHQPAPPDVHDHLKLTSTYCAPPPPPLSPPKEAPPRGRQPALSLINGRYATAEKPDFQKGHERRRSWNGDMGPMSGEWEETVPDENADTPTPDGGRPALATRPDDAKNERSMAPRGGPVGVMDLFTPPRSLSPSPPPNTAVASRSQATQSAVTVPESPSTATTSPSSLGNSPADEYRPLPDVVIDSNDHPRESASSLQSASYQELIEKYCFFQSTGSALPSPTPRPPNAPAYSGVSSVWGSDVVTPTGRGYSAATDTYFNFEPQNVYWGAEKSYPQQQHWNNRGSLTSPGGERLASPRG